MMQATTVLCPEKAAVFKNVPLSINAVGERITEISDDIYNQMSNKSQEFCVCAVALRECTDVPDSAHLVIFLSLN